VRILLSRTDRIGDLILSTPAIATVRASFPDAHITMATSSYNRIVMERSDDVDELVDIPLGANAVAFGSAYRGYDLAVALAPRAQDLQLVGATRAKVRVGYTYVRRLLARATARLYVNRLMLSEADPELCERDPSRVVRHEVDQLLDLAGLAGANERRRELRLDLTDADRSAVDFVPKDPIVMHLAPRWLSGGSTLESAIQLARELSALGAPLVLTYAPESDDVAGAFGRAKVAALMLRGLPFFQWAAVFERARCVVTVDTGATHVASAVRRPTVVVFEHRFFRLNSQEWAPYRVPHALVRKPADESEASLAASRAEIVDAVRSLIQEKTA
jgi:ADP-heptose:LPS heptosyltransferase